MSELERWLPTLQPAAGGAQRLRQAIADSRPRAGEGWPGYAWATLAVLVIALSPLYLTDSQPSEDSRVAGALTALASRPVRVVSIAQGDAVEVTQSEPSVRVFLVMRR